MCSARGTLLDNAGALIGISCSISDADKAEKRLDKTSLIRRYWPWKIRVITACVGFPFSRMENTIREISKEVFDARIASLM